MMLYALIRKFESNFAIVRVYIDDMNLIEIQCEMQKTTKYLK